VAANTHRVWIDVAKILGAPTCWVECMKLVPEDLSDPPNGCKLRPGEGMTAIGELDPGMVLLRILYLFTPRPPRLTHTMWRWQAF
jgi:hypothetical protein